MPFLVFYKDSIQIFGLVVLMNQSLFEFDNITITIAKKHNFTL